MTEFGFDRIEPPDMEKLHACVHCGFCLPSCPTYKITGLEAESPRGRLYLMKAVAAGEIPLETGFVEHMDLCLNCRTCEDVCPSGVKFGELMEHTRNQIERRFSRNFSEKYGKKLVLEGILAHPRRLTFVFRLLKLYQVLGLQKFIRKTGLLKKLGRIIAASDMMISELPKKIFEPPPGEIVEAQGSKRFRIGFFSGCIMRTVYADINYATVRVLARNGCEVVIPSSQNCCAAVHLHNGIRKISREMARQNIRAFENAQVDYVIINSAGCGATLKEYSHLLEEDPEYAQRARNFSSKVLDFNEFLAMIGIDRGLGEIGRRVTYQDPCHLAHAQRIKYQPRELLKTIPGLQLVEMAEADICCGGAGTYSISEYDMSMKILDQKMANAIAVKPDMIVTSNPPCLMQLKLGARRIGLNVPVVHVAELLDEAYNLFDKSVKS